MPVKKFKEFLDSNDVAYQVGGSGGDDSAADIAERARRFTVFIECRF